MKKILMGISAFVPTVLIVLGLVMFFMGIATSTGSTLSDEGVIYLILYMACMFGGFIFCIVNLILFIIHASKNQSIDENQRVLWILGMFFMSAICIPVYWWVYILKE